MKNFNYQQKIAIMRVLLDILNADGRIDAREKTFYEHVSKNLELPPDSIEDVRNKISILALVDIKNFNDAQKHYLLKLMNQMVIADEDIDVNEVAVYDVVRQFCQIPQEFVEEK